MDQALLRQLAQFKLLLRKASNHSVDIEKLISDRAYAKQVLSLAEESDNEVLILLALELKDKLGMLPKAAPAETKPATEKAKDDATDAATKGKYVFGARG